MDENENTDGEEGKHLEEKSTVGVILCPIKPLDFIRPKGNLNKVGMITEISSFLTNKDEIYYQASVEWIGGSDGLHSAWWGMNEIEVIDSLPRLLSRELAHPFGSGEKYIDNCYPK
jgi:hypothetical protein